MELIEYNVFRRDTRTASGKAKYDASDILSEMGFRHLYEPSAWRSIRVAQQMMHVINLPKESVVVVQYPGNKSFFYKLLKRRDIKTIALIHDIEALRKESADSTDLLLFDRLISHNAAMTKAIREMGFDKEIYELGLFDYLSTVNKISPERPINTVAFAGNFSKASFVNSLGDVNGLRFILYGTPSLHIAAFVNNVEYRGSYPSEEIASKIEGSWGLVWDGSSIDTCSGETGRYLRYNCPHKASMYIVAERPIVVWDQAAIADIVRREGIGITVPSLHAAVETIANIDSDQYDAILTNVRRVRRQLVDGHHLKNAMKASLEGLPEQFSKCAFRNN